MIGCGNPDFSKVTRDQVGCIPKSVSYHVYTGEKFKDCDNIDYSSRGATGDTIVMTIDMRPFKSRLSFSKNGNDMGTAFLGLSYWGDIYIMFSLWEIGHRIKVVKYEVVE